MPGFKGRLNDLYFNVTGVTLQKLNSFLLRRALVSTTELKYQRGLQSRLRNQVNPHGVQGWFRYICHLPSERSLYNASRPIFSRWERDSQHKQTGNRTSNEKAFKDFEDSKKMICGVDGPIAEMRCGRIFSYSHVCIS